MILSRNFAESSIMIFKFQIDISKTGYFTEQSVKLEWAIKQELKKTTSQKLLNVVLLYILYMLCPVYI